MKRLNFSRALTVSAALAVLFFAGCATIETRISEHPEIYNELSPRDQALVRQGRIREGMTMDAVWVAWGSPEQKALAVGTEDRRRRGFIVLITMNTIRITADMVTVTVPRFRWRRSFCGRTSWTSAFVAIYDPFYDPFFYPRFRQVSYPYKTVTFSNGRVVAFQQYTPPRGY